MIRIGVSACFQYPSEVGTDCSSQTLLYMGRDMTNYLGRGGAMPILIPDLPDEKLFVQFLQQMDGFILQGGKDINPGLYDEPDLTGAWEGDSYRDQYELKILQYAFAAKKPVLGVCRGMQLLNVFFGGSLYQDIPMQLPQSVSHLDPQAPLGQRHLVHFTPGGLLQSLHACGGGSVNSVHHQAVKKLGQGLVVEAVSPDDGVIEAIRWAGSSLEQGQWPFGLIMGVQWHPEIPDLRHGAVPSVPLLDHFLNLCELGNSEPQLVKYKIA